MEAARAGAEPHGVRGVGEGIYNLVERWIEGKKITKKVAREAFDDARGILDELKAAGVNFPWPQSVPAPHPNGHAPNGHTRRPPPPDPDAIKRAELAKARVRARQSLGFEPQQPLTVEIIKKRQRELARKYHPDRQGGSLDRMKNINAAADVLLKAL